MGLVGKLKNILFEEEEVEIPVIEKKEKKISPVGQEPLSVAQKEEVRTVNYQEYNNLEPVIQEEKKMEEVGRNTATRTSELVSERELFKNEKTFNFPAFDEEEFDNFVPKKRSTNIMEHERKKNEKKGDYQSTIRTEYKKPEEVKEAKKFKPSPIISPVYGILDKNYTPDEITTRQDSPSRTLDVDTVRKKAFGAKDEKKEKFNYEEEITIDNTLEEKLQKARTIDELLKDSSDEIIDIKSREEEKPKQQPKHAKAAVKDEETKTDVKKEIDLEDDTLENDLFDLIDSMYEDREEEK